MTPVYQTILDKGHGNCMQATIASIFDLKYLILLNLKLDGLM